jgi:hypothetical protein
LPFVPPNYEIPKQESRFNRRSNNTICSRLESRICHTIHLQLYFCCPMTKPQVFSADIMNYGFFTPCSFFNGTIAVHPSPSTNRSPPLVEKEPSDTVGSGGRHFKCGKDFKLLTVLNNCQIRYNCSFET